MFWVKRSFKRSDPDPTPAVRLGVRMRTGKAAVRLEQQVKGQETAATVRVCRGSAIPEDYILQIKGILNDASCWHSDPQHILLGGHVSRDGYTL